MITLSNVQGTPLKGFLWKWWLLAEVESIVKRILMLSFNINENRLFILEIRKAKREMKRTWFFWVIWTDHMVYCTNWDIFKSEREKQVPISSPRACKLRFMSFTASCNLVLLILIKHVQESKQLAFQGALSQKAEKYKNTSWVFSLNSETGPSEL